MKIPKKLQEASPAILRIGLALVYLWFGISQLLDPVNFIGYLPLFIFDSPYATTVVIINGVFEVIAGTLLLLGLFTRVASLLLALHLAAITFELGWGESAVRDFGLTIATIAVFLGGYDKWSLDYKRKK